MTSSEKKEFVKQVILGAREYGINTVLFRHIVGETLGVNVTDMECLGLLFFKGFATPSELSKYTRLSSGSTTAMLDRLEKNNLIERRPNPEDRRSTLIVIVKETAEKIAPLFASVHDAQEELISSYTQEELELLADFFTKSVSLWEEAREKLQKTVEKKERMKYQVKGGEMHE